MAKNKHISLRSAMPSTSRWSLAWWVDVLKSMELMVVKDVASGVAPDASFDSQMWLMTTSKETLLVVLELASSAAEASQEEWRVGAVSCFERLTAALRDCAARLALQNSEETCSWILCGWCSLRVP